MLLPLAALTSQVASSGGLGTLLGPGHLAAGGPLARADPDLLADRRRRSTRVFGTILAWLLVRDEFPGKAVVNAVIDLPFALPTIVASLILIDALRATTARSGSTSPLTRTAVVVALLFVTLPFVVRAVQPLLIEMDREMEEAAASLGAGGFTIFRRIIFPNLLPGLAAGVALAFARALGEFGSVLLFAGGLPDTHGLLGLHPPADRVRQRHRRRRGLGRAARSPRCCCSAADQPDPALGQPPRTLEPATA